VERNCRLKAGFNYNLKPALNGIEKAKKSLVALGVLTPPSDNILTDVIFGGDNRRKSLRLSNKKIPGTNSFRKKFEHLGVFLDIALLDLMKPRAGLVLR
jgi:hypothetical protein